ncbi:MAG: 1-acyl-sn-glycerol-3-phosphate acyltransferase [Dehalococcoidia bacterium]|jgi:1-acyl-sn-glycerol-3-phosphate acyltransferase|nr:1-acyl-sn-glycerol-3-phosphate acyltransferase [Dehalococcoidia bacterium]
MKLDARIAVAVMRVVYWLLLRWSVTGREHVPKDGPLVLIANHVHLADPLLLMLAFPRAITFLAKEELFRVPFIGMLMRDAGMFPVARTGTIQQMRDVMRQAQNLLQDGRVLAIFPEGKRSPSGVLLPAKAGAAMLSIHTGAPVVPVAIAGTEQIVGRWWWLKRPRVSVTIGTPLHIERASKHAGRSESARLTTQLMLSIARLLPPERRGPYAD